MNGLRISLALRFACVLAVFTLLRSGSGQTPAFRAWGSVRVKNFKQGEIQNERRFAFTVEAALCSWRISTEPYGSTNKYQEAFSNGEMYSLFEIGPGGNGHLDRSVQNSATREGSIDRKSFPAIDGTAISYVWQAYASACYLRDAKADSRLEPMWMLDDPRLVGTGYRVKAIWDVFADSGLPRRIDYLSDGKLHFWNAADESHGIETYPAPWNKGFTNAMFVVDEATNIMGITLPLKSQFVRSAIYKGAMRALTRVDVELAGVSAEPAAAKLPEYAGVITIRDKRFRGTNPAASRPVLSYQARNSTWPGTNEAFQAFSRSIEVNP